MQHKLADFASKRAPLPQIRALPQGRFRDEDSVPVLPGQVHDRGRKGPGEGRQDPLQEVQLDDRHQRQRATAPPRSNAETTSFDYASQANEQWTVNVADGDQRTMTAHGDRRPSTATGVDQRRDLLLEGRHGRLAAAPRDRAALRRVKLGGGAASPTSVSLSPQSVPPGAHAPLFASRVGVGDSPFAGEHAQRQRQRQRRALRAAAPTSRLRRRRVAPAVARRARTSSATSRRRAAKKT